jgi:hypothetical protein
MLSPRLPLSRNKHNQLARLGSRLSAIFVTLEVAPRTGPVPSNLRAEGRRVFNGIDRFLPPGRRLAESGRLLPSRKPVMFDLFYATMEAIQALNYLTKPRKIRPKETYPRRRRPV